MELFEIVRTLTKYKAWADELTFSAVSKLPEGEAIKKRQTRFGNMIHTLNHVYVIDDIFKAHLLGNSHGYTARNTETHPSLEHLWEMQNAMDSWYVEYAEKISEKSLSEIVNFQFVGGGEGAMSRADMIIHVVNHSTYHRGFVGDLMYQVPATPPANDFPVFLRDIHANT
ncbi:DinB family protein [Microbulbifer echini]|uniref:DinB family protein n=1 Tax=Microbulbifer echini TaxID=1529067 RepID=A0ABV4NU34_9GAMM